MAENYIMINGNRIDLTDEQISQITNGLTKPFAETENTIKVEFY